jgi:hypothetical protein
MHTGYPESKKYPKPYPFFMKEEEEKKFRRRKSLSL